MNRMFDFLLDVDNYEDRKVANDTAKSGITVDTAYTSDEGFETAWGLRWSCCR
jgi:hypothetical protein